MPEIAPGIEVTPTAAAAAPPSATPASPSKPSSHALAGGDPIDQIATDYGITRDDIRRAISFANDPPSWRR